MEGLKREKMAFSCEFAFKCLGRLQYIRTKENIWSGKSSFQSEENIFLIFLEFISVSSQISDRSHQFQELSNSREK